jgi:hypothetical protein
MDSPCNSKGNGDDDFYRYFTSDCCSLKDRKACHIKKKSCSNKMTSIPSSKSSNIYGRANNAALTFDSQVPHIVQMIQDNSLLTGELIVPPEQITAEKIGANIALSVSGFGGISNSDTRNLGTSVGAGYLKDFAGNSGDLAHNVLWGNTKVPGTWRASTNKYGPGNMTPNRRTISLTQKHWQAMATGTLVLNYRDAMVANMVQYNFTPPPGMATSTPILGLPATNGRYTLDQFNDLSGLSMQNMALAQCLYLDYGDDTPETARNIMSYIWGAVPGNGVAVSPWTASNPGRGTLVGMSSSLQSQESSQNPKVGTSAVLKILADPGSTDNGPVVDIPAVTGRTVADGAGAFVFTNCGPGLTRSSICGNASRLTRNGTLRALGDPSANPPLTYAVQAAPAAALDATAGNDSGMGRTSAQVTGLGSMDTRNGYKVVTAAKKIAAAMTYDAAENTGGPSPGTSTTSYYSNVMKYDCQTFSARVVLGNPDFFNSKVTPPLGQNSDGTARVNYSRSTAYDSGSNLTSGTNVIVDFSNVSVNGGKTRNLVSVGGAPGSTSGNAGQLVSNNLLAPDLTNQANLAAYNPFAGNNANKTQPSAQIAGHPMGWSHLPGGSSDATPSLAVDLGYAVGDVEGDARMVMSHTLSAGEIVIVATVIDNTPGQEAIQLTAVNAVNCAGTDFPICDVTYPSIPTNLS